jgi:transposase, IS5 family
MALRHEGALGTDLNGLVHTVVTTDAGASDFKQLPKLPHGQERQLYGDQAYWSEFHRVAARERGIRYRVNRRPNPGRPLTAYQRQLNRLRSAIRARGEHAFRVIKCLWGFRRRRRRSPDRATHHRRSETARYRLRHTL